MSLLDIVEEEFGTAGRGSKGSKSAKSTLPDLKDLKEPQPSRSKLQETLVGGREAVVIDWGESPLVQSVDKRSKELRESSDELQQAAGDDWIEVSNDPAQLIAFADSLAIVQIREAGRVPDTYVNVTTCQNCGEVPIWQGCPPRVKACPWCMNGLTAPAIPRD